MKTPFLSLPLSALFLAACATKPIPGQIRREFPADQITDVVFRAGAADTATVTTKKKTPFITVSGFPIGASDGYHSRDKSWRETPAAQWGLNFNSRLYGSTLVISTENEISYEHHRYMIEDLQLELPPSVRFVPQVRKLTSDGGPDLSPP